MYSRGGIRCSVVDFFIIYWLVNAALVVRTVKMTDSHRCTLVVAVFVVLWDNLLLCFILFLASILARRSQMHYALYTLVRSSATSATVPCTIAGGGRQKSILYRRNDDGCSLQCASRWNVSGFAVINQCRHGKAKGWICKPKRRLLHCMKFPVSRTCYFNGKSVVTY